VDPGAVTESVRYAVVRASATLRHRGPDGSGIWVDPSRSVVLGHRRLSVRDLSESGAQPMVSADGRWAITYNGELYGGAPFDRLKLGVAGGLHGTSDTEALLESIADRGVVETVTSTVGMFAFAAWDLRERVLWLARDRFGEKPLYYTTGDGRVGFASELKAMRVMGGFNEEIDRVALADYLSYGFVPGPRTIHVGVSKLSPGCVARFDRPNDAARVIRYWDPVELAGETPGRPYDDSSREEFSSLLASAVDGRLHSDVPVGALLSGGLDSTAVVAMMRRLDRGPVRTFTIGFGEAGFDESSAAESVALSLGTDHTALVVTPADAQAVIPMLPSIYDEPFADSSQIPTVLVSQLAREQVTVGLSGDGADELFGGYERYRFVDRLHGIRTRLPSPVRSAVAAGLTGIPAAAWDLLVGRLGGSRAEAALGTRPGRRLHKAGRALIATGSPYASLLRICEDVEALMVGGCESGSVWDPWSDVPASVGGGRHRAMLADTVGYLPDDLLVKVDRASMSVGLEIRTPYLDPAIFEFAWSLENGPDSHLLDRKKMLRDLVSPLVPESVVRRPKTGFGVPIGEWLRGSLHDWADDLLDPIQIARQGHLEPLVIQEMWRQHIDRRADHADALWAVLMFQAWLNEVSRD